MRTPRLERRIVAAGVAHVVELESLIREARAAEQESERHYRAMNRIIDTAPGGVRS